MPKYKLPVKEGDCFCVPLPKGGYALGVLAREKKGFMLGYFFKPRLIAPPDPLTLGNLKAKDSLSNLAISEIHDKPFLSSD